LLGNIVTLRSNENTNKNRGKERKKESSGSDKKKLNEEPEESAQKNEETVSLKYATSNSESESKIGSTEENFIAPSNLDPKKRETPSLTGTSQGITAPLSNKVEESSSASTLNSNIKPKSSEISTTISETGSNPGVQTISYLTDLAEISTNKTTTFNIPLVNLSTPSPLESSTTSGATKSTNITKGNDDYPAYEILEPDIIPMETEKPVTNPAVVSILIILVLLRREIHCDNLRTACL